MAMLLMTQIGVPLILCQPGKEEGIGGLSGAFISSQTRADASVCFSRKMVAPAGDDSGWCHQKNCLSPSFFSRPLKRLLDVVAFKDLGLKQTPHFAAANKTGQRPQKNCLPPEFFNQQ